MESLLAARSRSKTLATRSEHNISKAYVALLASRRSSHFAWVEGEIDGCPVVALVRQDGTVVADRRHRRRIALLDALDDRLATGATATVGVDPLSSLLTLIRACDRLRSVTVAASRSPGGAS
jgi:hypothetical protein